MLVPFVVAVTPPKDNDPTLVHTVPATKENVAPFTFKVVKGVPASAKVTVPAETVKVEQLIVPEKETVYVLDWSNITASEDVGVEAPEDPPDEVDQLVVEPEIHVPDPPTQ
jgi:hypothetical protein